MTSFSDTQETSCLFDSCDGCIEQVQHVLRINHVPFGTPFDFLILAQTLEHNSQLRTDLTVLLQSFVEGEKKMTHRAALGIIAVASGGSDFTPSANGKSLEVSGMSQPVNVLVDLLMSVGGSIQATAQNSGGHFDGRPPSSSAEPVYNEIPQSPPLAPSFSNHETSFEKFIGPDSKDRGAEADPTGSRRESKLDSNLDSLAEDSQPETASPHSNTEAPLVETLTRLELNALQVKHYLDSIDQRISRIEPRLDALPTYHPSRATTSPVSRSESGQIPDGRYSTLLAIETLPNPPELQKSRQETSSVDPAHRQSIPSDMPALLRSSSRQNHSRKKFEIPIITAAVLVLLLLLFWGFSQNTQPLVTGPANPYLPQNATIPTSAPTNHGNISQPPESALARRSASHPPATASSQEVHHRPLHSSAQAGLNVRPASSTPVTSAHPDDSSDSILYVPPVTVSSGVMAANIVSAPQPTYPKLASLTRMRGEVVMQAIISKDGTIENVHVIKGHRLLRGAATNAVRTWRYRPYLVNGQPVEVATTVSVDFNQAQ